MLSAVSQLYPNFVLLYKVKLLALLHTCKGHTEDLDLEGLAHCEVLVVEGGGALETMETSDGHLGHRGELEEGALVL